MTLIVNGEKVEDSVIQQELERLRPDYERVFKDQSPEEQKAQLFDWSKENVIERVLINQYVKANCKPVPVSEVESAFAEIKKQYRGRGQLPMELSAEDEKKIKEAIELQLRVEKVLRDACDGLPEPSQEAVLEFYEENKERFKTTEQIKGTHIVKHVNWQTDETDALSVLRKVQDELENGAIFETLVAKYSDCPDNGGDLGHITRGQMVEEFEDIIFNLGVGEVSDIFRTRFGFHIAKVYDRKPAVVHSLEEAKERVVSELKEQARRNAIDDFVDELKNKARIEEI